MGDKSLKEKRSKQKKGKDLIGEESMSVKGQKGSQTYTRKGEVPAAPKSRPSK